LAAIKIYDKQKLARSATQKKALQKEIAILKKLDHPCVCKVYDVIDSPSQVYLVMEYVTGQNLSSAVKRELFLKH